MEANFEADELFPLMRERSNTWPLSRVSEDVDRPDSPKSGDSCGSTKKKSSKKKKTEGESQSSKKENPWGPESYSDLITRALETHPEKRMQLNEIYEWFKQSKAYFLDRAAGEASAGWKVNFFPVAN